MKARTRLQVATTVVVVATLAFAPTADASAYYRANPSTTGCWDDAWIVRPTRGEVWNNRLIIRDKSGVSAGLVTVWHSGRCQTAWVTYDAEPGFGGEVSTWNSWNQNAKAFVVPGGVKTTRMIDDPVGVTSCVGVQVYYNNQWRRWQMGFCW